MKVQAIREIVEKYHGERMSMRELATAYGVERAQISRILRALDVDPRPQLKTGHLVPQPVGLIEQNLGRQFRLMREKRRINLHDFARLMARGINVIRWHEQGARMLRLNDIVRAAAILHVEPGQLCIQAPAKPKKKK